MSSRSESRDVEDSNNSEDEWITETETSSDEWITETETSSDVEEHSRTREFPEDKLNKTKSFKTLVELGCVLFARFRRLRHLEDLKKAIRCYKLAIASTSDDHAARPALFNNLGDLYLCRFKHLGQFTNMTKAIDCQNQAVLLTPDGHKDKADLLINLGSTYMRRFYCLDTFPDIENAIKYHIQAVLLADEDHTDKPGWLNNLGTLYQRRFERRSELDDINEAIKYQSQAVLLTPEDDEGKPRRLNNLGVSYTCRFERLGEIGDANAAIDCQAQAVLLTPDGHEDERDWLNNLGYCYRCRFAQFGELEDVNKAIDYQNRAVLLTSDSDAEKAGLLNNLGNSYLGRFERLGQIEDLERSIECHTKAVLLTSDDHGDSPHRLDNLGNAYLCRYERLGVLADIDQAIEWQLQAVKRTPESEADKPYGLSNLGTSYARRFEHNGELADIDNAINFHSQAMLLIPGDHSEKPTLLSNLGICYMNRFKRLSELSDINKAIDYQKQAVLLSPDGHAFKATLLNNLGNSYLFWFERLGEPRGVEEAVNHLSQAVKVIPDGHSDKPRWIANLGTACRRRFELLGEVADVEMAIECQNQALALTPDGHADIPHHLSKLGNGYLSLFISQRKLADIDMAIDYNSQAVLLTPDNNANQPGYFLNLGHSYMQRFESKKQHTDLEKACRCFQESAQLGVLRPSIQFSSAREWAKSLSLLGAAPQPAYQRALELVPHLIWLGTTVNQRYNLLIEIGDVAMEAAAWAILLQNYDLALEWLEEGRSIVWSQILQLRTPFDNLSAANPILAQRLKEISGELELAGSRSATATSPTNQPLGAEEDTQRHHRLATEWEDLLKIARDIPGFHDFMRPPKANELIHAAKDGPIILVNVHSSRCDALVIRQHSRKIDHIPLEGFSHNKALDIRVRLAPLVGRQGTSSDTHHIKRLKPQTGHSFTTMLATLWLDVVKPVLESLGFMHKQPVYALPHITWCTTGVVSFLPLHAAGCYDGLQPNTSDLAVSSYTPTLNALLAQTPQVHCAQPGILAVGQENTKGLSRLPCTRLELAAIKEHVGMVNYLQLEDENATVDKVLNAMDKHSWVHLACHATQQTDDPSQSAFHLHDGNLMLSTITKRSFKGKGLAFLSACETATGSGALPDEAVHLAAGMLMAGYPSVIATMWGIKDEDGPEIARGVYSGLLRDRKMDYNGAARALHKAVGHLRSKVGENAFERWVLFVHIGV